jgi:hypothetical protein
MREGRYWWVNIGKVKISLGLHWWNPLDTLEFKRSIKIDRLCNESIPFISVSIALLFVRMDWDLYL